MNSYKCYFNLNIYYLILRFLNDLKMSSIPIIVVVKLIHHIVPKVLSKNNWKKVNVTTIPSQNSIDLYHSI